MLDPLSVYHHLPYSLKVLIASARGYQLRRWRYSADTERLVEEALERESWSHARWQSWQEAELGQVLHRAATRVPFYRRYWQTRRAAGNRASWDYLENWPVLKKEDVREAPHAFVADDVSMERLYVDHTGGTTGKPTLVYLSRDTVRRWYALFEARLRRWNGVSYKERWAMFGGRPIAALRRTEPPFWVHNHGLNQIYFSIFHIKRETTGLYVDALRDYRPTHMIVFPSSVSVLAHHMLDLGLSVSGLKVILSNSEKVRPDQRAVIEKAFECRVIDTYGMAEVVSAGGECTAGVMHYWPEVGVTEIYDRNSDKVQGESGEFALTSLFNADMPLVRYLNGDTGTVPRWEPCRCGSALPQLGHIAGRNNDLIVTSDGRELYLLDSLFNGLPMIEAQLVQEAVAVFTVRLVPGHGFDADFVANAVERKLSEYMGSAVRVKLDVVTSISKNRNGKFVPYVSKIARDASR